VRRRRDAASGALLALPLALTMGLQLPAHAADSAAAYRVTWAGLPAGDVRIGFHDDGADHETEIDIASEGLPRLITKFRADAVGAVRVTDDGTAIPTRYRAQYDLGKHRGSRIDLRYPERDGSFIAVRGADDNGRKAPLAERFRVNAIDPLSTLAVMRHELARHRGETRRFVIPVFDGARRFDVVADVVSWNSGDGLVRLRLNLRPIAGFKGESSDDPDPDSAPRPVDVAFTKDAALIPVSLRVSVAYLPMVVRLDHFCASFDACDSKL
jgi:hypothetical protein